MIYTILDAETTSRYPASAMPVSVSYISYDESLKRVNSGIMYFCDDSIPESDYGALQVHGLSKSVLEPYRGDFQENIRKLYKLMWKGNLVGYNSDSFDIPILTHFLAEQGIVEKDKYGYAKDFKITSKTDIYKIVKPILPGKIMPNGRKGGKKLMDAVEHFGIKLDKMSGLYKIYFGKDVSKGNYHSAEYDTFATGILFCKLVKEGYIKL